MAASGVGALLGGLYLSTRKTVVGLGKVIMTAPAVSSGLGLIAFALSRNLWLSMLCMLVVGLGSILQIASSNTVLQTIVEDNKRGRVLSLFTLSFLGVFLFGSLLFGSLAHQIGAPLTLILGGSTCIIASFVFSRQLPSLKRLVRPVYPKAGLLTETIP